LINSIPISIIIPTHNRINFLLKILKSLDEQDLNLPDFEVIISADDCVDNTVDIINKVSNQYSFKILTLDGHFSNSASARNAGAEIARGKHLIFLDDDIIPFNDFIAQHYSNRRDNQVIIGYSKPVFLTKPSMWQYRARRWWEDRFYEMSQPEHQFNFMDFFSGNFSINRDLFFSVGGFAGTLKRHEDYEIGLKLIRAGIKFKFSYNIGGFHYETNDLKKWLARQKLYGYSNVRMINMHPEVSEYFFQETFELFGLYHKIQLVVKKSAFKKNLLTKYFIKTLLPSLFLIEKLRLYSIWEKIVGVLVVYHYWTGVASELGSYSDYLKWRNNIENIKVKKESIKSIELSEILVSEDYYVEGNQELKITFEENPLIELSPKTGAEPLNKIQIIAEVKIKLLEKINPSLYSVLSESLRS